MAEIPSLPDFAAGHSNSPRRTDGTVHSPLYSSNEFRMYCYKVLPCSKRFPHNWQTCPFAHPGEKARRRCVRSHGYSAIPCPFRQQGQDRPRGDACSMTHSIFEYWLHPDMYRTQLCNDVDNCNRSVCFFAHSLAQLRVPSLRPCTRDTTQLSPVTSELSSSPLAASTIGTAGLPHAYKHTSVACDGSSSSPWEVALQLGVSSPNAITCNNFAATTLQYNKYTIHQQQSALAATNKGAALQLTPQPARHDTILGINGVLQQLNIPAACSSSAVSTALQVLPRGLCLPVDVLATPSTPAAQCQLMPITTGIEIACGVGLPLQFDTGLHVAETSLPHVGSFWGDNTHMADNGLSVQARQDANSLRPEALGWMFRC